jgi:hypothetical protein
LQFIINAHEQVVVYTEFKGTNHKLGSRYSSTVHSLQELLMW